jgi:DNA processing protein
MNLLTAVAASMLPAARSRVAAAFKDVRREPSGPEAMLRRLLWDLGIPSAVHRSIVEETLRAAEDLLAEARTLAQEPIAVFDSRYPVLLACTPDPPPVLWVQGNPGVLAQPSVAVIGSRAASPYALEVGHRLAGQLAERGLVVASGLARGVDSAAHRGCLEAGGLTVAVLGSGLDRIYPAEHEGLAASISKQGALVSELGPGAPALPEHFPLRNRIISGISLAVVVVEASEKSGSLITARCALEQGRDVMAVPGSILSGRNRGSHSLLKDGAKVVETADDILEELGWPLDSAARPSGGSGQDKPALSERTVARLEGDPLVAKMDAGEAYALDELVGLSGTNATRLLARLMELELTGKVVSVGGRWKVC